MSQVAELGITLNAQGFITSANQAAGALVGLGGSAARTQSQVRQFATQGAISLGQLASSGARDIGSLLRSAANLGFALGPITGAIGLAIAGIGVHWWETRKEAKAAQDAMQRDMEAFEKNMTGAALRMRISRLEAQRDQIHDDIIAAQAPRGLYAQYFAGRDMDKTIAAAEALSRRIGALRVQEGKALRDAAREAAEEQAKGARKLADELKKAEEAQNKLWEALSRDLPPESVLRAILRGQGLLGPGSSMPTPTAPALPMTGTPDMAGPVGQFFDWLKAKIDKDPQMVMSGILGIAGGFARNAGGPLGGLVSGAISGSGAGVMGAVIGGMTGLVDGLLSLGESAEQQRREMEALQRQYDQFTDSIKEQLGFMSPLEARTRAAAREFAAMRDAIDPAGLATSDLVDVFRDMGFVTDEQIGKLNELNALERAYLDLLKQQEMQRANDIREDNRVLLLRIQGRATEAEAMQRQIDKQRELREAMDAGASAAEQMAIKERQRLEDILEAVGKAQAKIDSFAATISGLQTFRNALLLSDDAGLSPTARLAEARRQYEEILAKALGGDQAAAGQLSGAAQTLLQFSRAVNASGNAFQNDFQQILADNAEVIAKFEDLKTIEELMLEELRKIAADTGALSGRESRPDRPTDRGFLTVEESEALRAMVPVVQAVGVELRAELRELRSRVEEQTQVNRSGFQEFVTNTVN